jgi:type I restriction enzyme S subunit
MSKKSIEPAPVSRRFKPYSAYKASGTDWLREIPAHWTVLPSRRLIGRIEQGWSPVAEDRQAENDEWAVIKVGAVKHGKFVPSEHKTLPPDLTPDTRYEIHDGDFLVTRANTPDLVGDVCVARGVRPKLMLCDLVYRLQLRDRRLDPSFLAYWLGSRVGRFQIEVDARGASQSMVKVSQGHIRAWTVALPPVAEQLTVVAFLDRETAHIDELVSKKERLIELLQEKRTTLITQTVTRGLDPNVPMKDSEVEWVGKIPAHWKLVPLKTLLRRYDYGISESLVGSGGIRVLTMAHIQNGEIQVPEEGNVNEVDENLFLENGDLLFNRTNSRDLVAKVGIFRGTRQDRVAFASYLVRLTAHEGIVPEWLNFLLNSSGLLGLARRMALLSVNQANLNPTKYTQIHIPFLPEDEQRRIAEHINRETARIDALVAKVRDAIDRLGEFRSALISAAVTGKIDVREEIA